MNLEIKAGVRVSQAPAEAEAPWDLAGLSLSTAAAPWSG